MEVILQSNYQGCMEIVALTKNSSCVEIFLWHEKYNGFVP